MPKSILCPECGYSNNYYRRKTEDFVCRRCGREFKLADAKTKERIDTNDKNSD